MSSTGNIPRRSARNVHKKDYKSLNDGKGIMSGSKDEAKVAISETYGGEETGGDYHIPPLLGASGGYGESPHSFDKSKPDDELAIMRKEMKELQEEERRLKKAAEVDSMRRRLDEQKKKVKELRGTSGNASSQQADWPLQFHQVHGENIELSHDRKRAKRADSFCKGICFSNRPVAIGERVHIKFIDTSGSWSGVLRFGFTSTDPGTLRAADLPRYACPDMTNKPGNWAKALGERYAVCNNELFFYVTRSGDVIYGVNGEEKGLFFSGVNANVPIWALLDIYGNTSCVEFSSPPPLNNVINTNPQITGSVSMQPETFTTMTSLMINDNRNNNRENQNIANNTPVSRYHINVEFAPLTFHTVCGKNVRISTDHQVAMRTKDEYCNAYVFTSRPLRCGEKVVLQVQGVDRQFIGGLAFGFTSCDPSTLKPEDLPDDSDLLLDRLEYWVVNKDVCRSPEMEDELSFHLTNDGEVCYSRNNFKTSTLMHVDRTLPLWAFFDVYGNVQKIKMLGTTIPQAPRPFPRSRSTSGALTVSLPPQPPQRHSMAPTTLSLNQHPPPAVSRSFSVPASMVPSPTTPKQPVFPKQPLSMPGTPSSINENPVADNENNECNVCYERPVNAVLYTCGHMCMCFECAQAVKRERTALCPICRQEIKDVIKIYRS